jgi:hypothetical protein
LEGYGFVKKVQGVGTGTIATIKCNEVFGGVAHSKIPFPALTVAVFGQDWECEDLESNLQKSKYPRSLTTIPVMILQSQRNNTHNHSLQRRSLQQINLCNI